MIIRRDFIKGVGTLSAALVLPLAARAEMAPGKVKAKGWRGRVPFEGASNGGRESLVVAIGAVMGRKLTIMAYEVEVEDQDGWPADIRCGQNCGYSQLIRGESPIYSVFVANSPKNPVRNCLCQNLVVPWSPFGVSPPDTLVTYNNSFVLSITSTRAVRAKGWIEVKEVASASISDVFP